MEVPQLPHDSTQTAPVLVEMTPHGRRRPGTRSCGNTPIACIGSPTA